MFAIDVVCSCIALLACTLTRPLTLTLLMLTIMWFVLVAGLSVWTAVSAACEPEGCQQLRFCLQRCLAVMYFDLDLVDVDCYVACSCNRPVCVDCCVSCL